MSEDRTEEVARIPDNILISQVTALSLSSEGRYLAVEARHHGQIFGVLIVDLTSATIEFVEQGFGDALDPHANLWLSHDRYLLTGATRVRDAALILFPALEQVAVVEGLPGGLAAARGEALFVLDPEGRRAAPDARTADRRTLAGLGGTPSH